MIGYLERLAASAVISVYCWFLTTQNQLVGFWGFYFVIWIYFLSLNTILVELRMPVSTPCSCMGYTFE